MALQFRMAPKHAASAAKDMTVGSPLKLIFLYSVPLLAGNLVQQLYSMADTIIVGRLLGTEALAAVGNTGPMNFLVLGFVLGLTSGFAVITAQQFGAKNEAGVRRSVAMNIILNGVFAVIMTVLSVATARPLLELIRTPQSIMDGSCSYIVIIYLGICTTVLYNATACILRALGDSKSPLYFLIISSLLNIGLDVLFILQFNMGIAGAAWATVISQAFAGFASLVYMIVRFPILRVSRKDFEFNPWFAWQHLRIGLPMAFQFSITAIGVVVLQGALNVFGPVKIAAYTAAQKVEQLIAVAASTFGVTMANYTGQNLGAGRLDRIKEGTRTCSLLTIGVSLISMLIALLLAEQLTGLFVKGEQPEVILAAAQYLHITSVFYPVLFIIFVYRNVLQSIGRGFMPLMAGVGELVARAAAAYTLPALMGYTGICFAGPLAWFAAALPLFIAYTIIMKTFKIENAAAR
ncbi:MATE family efflux transporter [Treponema brennaborense]|uniref:MATE efflux family protein n=1 Tax=Treponema brennaborense (strain DSM 12168 / CIP 105900 / DD5/3) TaxID=906968 RepID=F4LP67_TREBD|nr:MATE family efflux transporter [Treponema brennaborense]AEE15943.1 MATE efflux family protein [Treponema brennaborense DSM 12168]